MCTNIVVVYAGNLDQLEGEERGELRWLSMFHGPETAPRPAAGLRLGDKPLTRFVVVQGRRRFRQAQESKGEEHDGFERLRHPIDRNGRSVPTRYTTAELDEALGEYRTACDAASQAVRRKLRDLATTLSVRAITA